MPSMPWPAMEESAGSKASFADGGGTARVFAVAAKAMPTRKKRVMRSAGAEAVRIIFRGPRLSRLHPSGGHSVKSRDEAQALTRKHKNASNFMWVSGPQTKALARVCERWA